jgi:hypothetical protein
MAPKDKTPLPYEILPPVETPIWRYLSLAKLLAMLRTKSVFLCRADLFDDAFEGSFTEGSLRDYEGEWGVRYPDNHATMTRWIPCQSFVSCWHASEHESAALWKIYAGAEGALAIRSTIGALQVAFPSTSEFRDDLIVSQDIRRIQYIDYRTAHPYLNDPAGPLCYKRQAYSFEREIRVIRQELPSGPSPRAGQPNGRAIQMGPPPKETGREIAVNLEHLIEAIYIAPNSPDWLLPAVRETIKAFGFHGIDCRQSSLDELPEFGRMGAAVYRPSADD